MAAVAATEILDEFPVTASPPAPAAVLPLTFFDVPWLFTGPVERVFFYAYPHAAEYFRAHLLPALLSSLSAALHRFHPLLGRVRSRSEDAGGGFELFSPGGGGFVDFVLAESSDDFEELSGSRPRELGRLYSLVPRLPPAEGGAVPLLAAVQVTVFAGRGFAVGVSIHHVACDDSSYMHFMKSWAAHCRAAAAGEEAAVPLPPSPFFDRGLVADPDGLAVRTLAEMKQLAVGGPPPPPPGPPPKLLIASFTISRGWIDNLKQGVIAKAAAAGNGGAPGHCSAFTVACAFAWACLTKADGSCTAKKKAHLLFSVECRCRLSPPIPQEYFGNCLRPCFVEVDTGDLLGANGVVTAAEAIGRAIKGLEDGVLDGADGWFQNIVSLVPERPMSVGGSPRYSVYDTDFGLGRPKKVELVSIDKTPGTVSLAEGRDGQGGIEIGVVLPEAEMEQFSSCFSDGLKLL